MAHRTYQETMTVAWDLWQDRNGDNAKRKSKRLHEELQLKVEIEFDIGYEELHPKHQLMFTRANLEKRKTFRDQSNVSWLLRVCSARKFARTEPWSREDQERVRAKARQRIFLARRERIENQMRTMLAGWLQRKDQAEQL
jgi:hypothetical protein